MSAVIVKETHHQRGVGPSITPEIRSVIQLKFRLLRTSGACASGFSTDGVASPWITSVAVVAPFIFYFSVILIRREPEKDLTYSLRTTH
jgi:hypothetical protein